MSRRWVLAMLLFHSAGCARYSVVSSPTPSGAYIVQSRGLDQFMMRCEANPPTEPVCVVLSEEESR